MGFWFQFTRILVCHKICVKGKLNCSCELFSTAYNSQVVFFFVSIVLNSNLRFCIGERERESYYLIVSSIDVLTLFLKWIVLGQKVIREQQLKLQRTRIELVRSCFGILVELQHGLDHLTSLPHVFCFLLSPHQVIDWTISLLFFTSMN